MKVAVIGSRNLVVQDLGKYLPEETMEIVSRGERDRYLRKKICPRKRAKAHRVSAGI